MPATTVASENDQIEIDGQRIRFADLTREDGTRISPDTELLKPVAVEKVTRSAPAPRA